MRYIKLFILASAVLATLLACNKSVDQLSSSVTLLNFTEFEKDVEPYRTRVIVSDNFMRFDDGEGDRNFILFDRQQNIIYSVNDDEETIMLLKEKSLEVKPPFDLKLAHKKVDSMTEAPSIDNKTPQHYQFLANGELCYEVIAVPGLLPQVVTAMQAFNRLIASDSATTFNNLPADLHNACDISMSTFAVGRHLEYGFPLQEWAPKGSGRSLIDYKENYQPDPALFVLPEKFQKYDIQAFREGNVQFED